MTPASFWAGRIAQWGVEELGSPNATGFSSPSSPPCVLHLAPWAEGFVPSALAGSPGSFLASWHRSEQH